MATKLAPGRFLGDMQETIEVAGLTFSESLYATDLFLPKHEHENAFFYFVIEGMYEETFGRETRQGGPSTLVFHPAGEPHSNRWKNGGGRVFHIEISGSRAEALRAYGAALDSPAERRAGPVPWLASRLYREYRRPDGPSRLGLEGLALEIVAEISRGGGQADEPGRTPPRWLEKARELLHARFAENLPLEDVASSVGVHPVHLARVFRRHHDCSPGDYVRKLRVQFACERLAGSDAPLCEIALEAGFSDQSHLTRTFRQQLRVTPGAYRRLSRRR
ncbi:helix-turn-helix domain-containing protein [Singulisphaera sp. PoT]|uniref:AraC family transcriptional regulator n=1 Tax=Singulisphaera sp. PoT TaxID=3411797 RepID=UPI003BF5E71B